MLEENINILYKKHLKGLPFVKYIIYRQCFNQVYEMRASKAKEIVVLSVINPIVKYTRRLKLIEAIHTSLHWVINVIQRRN